MNAKLQEQITSMISSIDLRIAQTPLTSEDLRRLSPSGFERMNVALTLDRNKNILKSYKIEKLILQSILNPTTTKEMLSSYRSKYLECISQKLEEAETDSRMPNVSVINIFNKEKSKFSEGAYLTVCKSIQERFEFLDRFIKIGMDIIDQRNAPKLTPPPEDSDTEEEEEEDEEEDEDEEDEETKDEEDEDEDECDYTILTNWRMPCKPDVICFVKRNIYIYERVRTTENPEGVIDWNTSVAIQLPGRSPLFSNKFRHYRNLVIIV
jgi:hypothetical protein